MPVMKRNREQHWCTLVKISVLNCHPVVGQAEEGDWGVPEPDDGAGQPDDGARGVPAHAAERTQTRRKGLQRKVSKIYC